MKRYVLELSYNGEKYSGYQKQDDFVTVQSTLEAAMFKILRIDVPTYAAGRTDAGVHANQLHVQFDYDAELHPKFRASLNAVLPPDISVGHIFTAVNEGFHVRFSALSRRYLYKISKRKMALESGFAYHVHHPLDLLKMQEAAEVLKEYNSFESFCKSRSSNKTYLCDILESRWEETDHHYLYHVQANRFLRGMVRTLVGTFILIGRGKLEVDDLRKIIEAKDRTKAGSSAPPQGLYLMEVEYPKNDLKIVELAP